MPGRNGVQEPDTQHSRVLTSWKEIASFFGKGVRTVQRWEWEFGLPVRRPSENRHVVHASPEELRTWLVSWSQRRPKADGLAPGNNGRHSEIGAGVDTSRELRKLQRQLVREVTESVFDLAEQCRAMTLSMNDCAARPERPLHRAVRLKR